MVLGFSVMDLPFTRALYPPGGERLGKNPTMVSEPGWPLLRGRGRRKKRKRKKKNRKEKKGG
jgi:hypothetical protein